MKKSIAENLFMKKSRNNKNKTCVGLCIRDEADLYNKFSVFDENNDNLRISGDVIDYLINETLNIPVKNSLVIKLKIQNGAKNNNNIEKILKDCIYQKISLLNNKIRKINIKSILLAFLGMALIGSTQIFQIIEKRLPLNEFIIVMSWVFMWTAVDFWFFKKAEMLKEKRALMTIYYSEIKG